MTIERGRGLDCVLMWLVVGWKRTTWYVSILWNRQLKNLCNNLVILWFAFSLCFHSVYLSLIFWVPALLCFVIAERSRSRERERSHRRRRERSRSRDREYRERSRERERDRERDRDRYYADSYPRERSRSRERERERDYRERSREDR